MDLKRIDKILKKSSKNTNCIATQEGYTVEYKQSFGWGNMPEYAKAMAAMANNKGGHIIFGIKDKPHELLGLDQKSARKFLEKDLSKWSEYLRDSFEPQIEFERELFEFEGNYYGIIEVVEAYEKPIICKKYVEGKNRIGAIYYRYKAENTEIQYAELRKMIDAEKNKINEMWFNKIKQISVAGISNTMVLNTKNGRLSGNRNNYYIDEGILEKIRFVDKGKFVESDGEPVLTIVGEVTSVTGAPVQVTIGEKEIALSDNRVIEAMLNKEKISDEKEFISYILNLGAKHLPIFYYLQKEDKNQEESVQFIQSIMGQETKVKFVVSRVKKEYSYYDELIDTGSEAYKKKKQLRDQVMNQDSVTIKKEDIKYFACAIRSLPSDYIKNNEDKLIQLLRNVYHSSLKEGNSNARGEFRKAICYLDEVLFS